MSKKISIKNYSSGTSPSISIGKIQQFLANVGANAVTVKYKEGHPVALSFVLNVTTQEGQLALNFTLPARIERVHELLQKVREAKRRTREQARKTAWANLRDWVDAQVALIQSEQVVVSEVFLPYLVLPTGKSLFEAVATGEPITFLE